MRHPISAQTFHWRTPLLLIFGALIYTHAHATLHVTESSDSITIHLGSGSNVSYLAFAEFSLNPKSIIYAWHYDGLTNTDGTPRTGYDLFNAVATETAGSPWALSYSTDDYGLITFFTIGSTISRVVDPLKSPVWTYWIQGGSEFVQYANEFEEDGETKSSFSFLVGNSMIISPSNWDTRYISNGSYDVWTITPFSYTGVASDTHTYTDISGSFRTVTFGSYTGPAPVLKRSPTVLSLIIAENQLQIIFSVLEGGVYQLQQQEGLTQNGWQNFEPTFIAMTSQKTYALPMNNPSERSFFRLIRKE
jgi:hypothetical protein